MTDHPVVLASFEDVKRVKTRKTWQLIFEVPEERYDAAIHVLGGSPQSGSDRWVGIARVDEKLALVGPTDDSAAATVDTKFKAKRPWDEVSPREQACIRCNEPAFGLWLHEYLGGDDPDFPVEQAVKNYCGVTSRSELNTSAAGEANWRRLDEEYQDYIGQQRYAEQLAAGPT